MSIKKVYDSYLKIKLSFYEKYVMFDYEKKRALILRYANTFRKYNIFIETGTFLGDTVELLKNNFTQLISFELSEELATKAQNRFADIPKIKIIAGDSGKLLPDVLKNIHEPCIFWLDVHYSSEFWMGDQYIKTAKGEKETPVLEELESILSHPIKKHTILIDDARCFNGKGDYPKIKEIKKQIENTASNYRVKVKNDIIRITPENETKN